MKGPEKPARFIAGAVCPACGIMDRLQVVGEGDARKRRCVSCGHEDRLSGVASPSPRSRLDGALRRQPTEDGVRAVRILGGGDRGSEDGDEGAPPEGVGPS